MSPIIQVVREPLVHFVLFGVLIFGLAGALGDEPDDHVILVSDELREALVADYERKRGEPPASEAVEGLVQTWIEDELLHREARRLEMGVGDPVIRRRLIQAMRFLVEDQAVIAKPTDEQLELWLAKYPERYQLPARVSFDHVFFRRQGADAEARARADKARDGVEEPQLESSDPFVHGLSISGMSRARTEATFGTEFATAVFDLVPQQWSQPIRSSFGYHLVRVSSQEDGRVARLTDLRERVHADWLNQQRDEAVADTLASLRAGYTITREDLQ